MKAKILRKGQGKLLLEGDELTEVYCNTGKICFAVSTLLPGQRASIDKGHSEADEVCYVAQGQIVVNIPDANENYLLNCGDALLIPPGVPHFSVNVGEEKSIVIWACAPKP
jgi:uncharacterized RmlC-like cupin family protein